jgi:hypothetical protein
MVGERMKMQRLTWRAGACERQEGVALYNPIWGMLMRCLMRLCTERQAHQGLVTG